MAIITETQEPALQRLALVFHLLGLRSSGPKVASSALNHPIQEVSELELALWAAASGQRLLQPQWPPDGSGVQHRLLP